MTTKKTPSDQATEQQLHRQQQKEAKEKQSQKKALGKMSKHICAKVYDIYPELINDYDFNSGEIPDEALDKIEDIALVLRYFANHPRVLDSLKTGVLSANH